ncbi:NUDIX domain-containing protein [Actinoplanes sp. DH11]|uniref:NUDIX hydrolase n=1 Tax=Actinoplanes sp. DH11 TaxID=2857011 RepID=UPI001E453742|nr:NUDIX domain-containing protein [Actinoplanes sp. DH11]
MTAAPGRTAADVVAAAWVHVRDRRVLVVRTAGSDAFYLPGGKPEPGETHAATAARETFEEVGVRLNPAALRPFTTIEAPAHNRPPGTRVRLICFTGEPDAGAATEPAPANEIAELAWFGTADIARCAPAIQILVSQLAAAGLID